MQLKHYPETWRSSNVYLVFSEKTYLIDPSLPPEKIAEADEVDVLLATHGHWDHLNQVERWRHERKLPFYLAKDEVPLIQDQHANASELFCQPASFAPPDFTFKDGDILQLEARLRIRCMVVPGHTKGSSFYLFEEEQDETYQPKALFTGDTIFANTIGRMDLPTGSELEMQETLKRFLSLAVAWPKDLPVLPGHGPAISLGDLLHTNPYLSGLNML